ncbi:hypothetical protein LVY72_22120 [Arthrobacter sp. I2-34]|uniref:Uncharacterized protein n=1 Tax=Arthrobacter hankyongi TaxID=2904801 RepID=A0ABS9LDD6_9MICC|nr:hypothetical protein [Arthrobacter hankyongi]MCG2624591.1 hypothetical protein [Arthrobacter hankyongi]
MHVCFQVATVAAAAVLALTSCSPPAVPGPDATSGASATAATPPPAAVPPATAGGTGPAARPQEPGSQTPQPGKSMSRSAQWGSYSGRQEACVAVAANVAVLLLVPLSFLTEVDQEELADLEAQVAKTRNRVPRALEKDFAHLEKVLAKNNANEEFDDEAFLDAVEPIQDWLAANCAS